MVIALCTIKHLWIWTCWTNCTVFFVSILVDFFHFKFVLLDNFCSCCYYNYIASLTSYWTKLYRKNSSCYSTCLYYSAGQYVLFALHKLIWSSWWFDEQFQCDSHSYYDACSKNTVHRYCNITVLTNDSYQCNSNLPDRWLLITCCHHFVSYLDTKILKPRDTGTGTAKAIESTYLLARTTPCYCELFYFSDC